MERGNSAATRRGFLSGIIAAVTGSLGLRGDRTYGQAGRTIHARSGPPPAGSALTGTSPGKIPGNILKLQVQEVSQHFLNRIALTPAVRDHFWHPDFSSVNAYHASVVEHRKHLRKILGLIETKPQKPAIKVIGKTRLVRIEDVVLPLASDFNARALLFIPAAIAPTALIIAVPPAYETKEQFTGIVTGTQPPGWLTALLTRRIAVCVPTTIERKADGSLCQRLHLNRRRLLHRLGFVVGRTLTGLEVQQVLGLRSFLESHVGVPANRTGILGTGQGGMTALYAGAIDEDWGAVSVINYFQQREDCWKEPVDRMLYGQLNEFGDAEVAALIAPRPLTVVHVAGGPTPTASVESEAKRTRRFYEGLNLPNRMRVERAAGDKAALKMAAEQMADTLGSHQSLTKEEPFEVRVSEADANESRDRHFEEWHEYLKKLGERSGQVREERWKLLETPAGERKAKVGDLQRALAGLMGTIAAPNNALHPRTSVIQATDKFVAYSVLLDAVPQVHIYGQLLVPRGLKGRLPVVICQHGNGGAPKDVTGIVEPWVNYDLDHDGEKPNRVYHKFAAHLAECGYVTFAPYVCVPNPAGVPEGVAVNPLVRQAAAIGMMRTSIELAKLHRIIDFIQTLPFADAERIGYYGLSYGGYDAIWMPPLEPRIKAVVISGNFNDWCKKITDEVKPTSYMFHEDEDFYNWDVLNYFTHLELIASKWPQPVCVEWGVKDAVTPPEWHWEAWAQVETLIQAWHLDNIFDAVFTGPHEVHGVETFEFLDLFLRGSTPPTAV